MKPSLRNQPSDIYPRRVSFGNRNNCFYLKVMHPKDGNSPGKAKFNNGCPVQQRTCERRLFSNVKIVEFRDSFLCLQLWRSWGGTEGHIVLGLSVCSSIMLCIWSRMVRDKIFKVLYGMCMKNKGTCIFFFLVWLIIAELCPFFDFCIVSLLDLNQQNF